MKIYIVKANDPKTGYSVISELFTSNDKAKAYETYMNNLELEKKESLVYFTRVYETSNLDLRECIK